MSNNNIDRGDKSDENSTNVQAYYSCDKCDVKFDSPQELKEHTDTLINIMNILFFYIFSITGN